MCCRKGAIGSLCGSRYNLYVIFFAVGDGDDLDRCKKIANKNSRIIFLGKQNNVESIMNISDIGVLLTNISKIVSRYRIIQHLSGQKVVKAR